MKRILLISTLLALLSACGPEVKAGQCRLDTTYLFSLYDAGERVIKTGDILTLVSDFRRPNIKTLRLTKDIARMQLVQCSELESFLNE